MRKKFHQFVSAISKTFPWVPLNGTGCTSNCIFNVKAASPEPFPGKVALVKALDVMMNKRVQSKETPPV